MHFTSKQAMDAIWTPAWHDSKPNRTWGYFLWAFTPIAMLMRRSGRDELRLKFTQKVSHWISRKEPIKSESFKHQF